MKKCRIFDLELRVLAWNTVLSFIVIIFRTVNTRWFSMISEGLKNVSCLLIRRTKGPLTSRSFESLL